MANTVDVSKSPILKLASYFIIMVKVMDQDSISEEVGCDRHGNNEIWPSVVKLLKMLQIIKQRQPDFCTPADFYSSRANMLVSFLRNTT